MTASLQPAMRLGQAKGKFRFYPTLRQYVIQMWMSRSFLPTAGRSAISPVRLFLCCYIHMYLGTHGIVYSMSYVTMYLRSGTWMPQWQPCETRLTGQEGQSIARSPRPPISGTIFWRVHSIYPRVSLSYSSAWDCYFSASRQKSIPCTPSWTNAVAFLCSLFPCPTLCLASAGVS